MIVLNGFVKIHRKLIQWGWYKNSPIKDTFLHLLLTANFKDMEWEDTTIKRGQVITSYKNLASDTGLTVQQVRTAISKLKSTGEITSVSTNKYTLITLVNYEDYQSLDEIATSEITSIVTNEQQTTNKQLTNNQQQRKNDKNDKNNNICANDIFESLWKLYPIKRGKGNISKTQKEKLLKIGYDKMKRAIDRYIAEQEKKETDIKFYKNGSTFFNSGYIDYLDENFTDVKEKGRSYEELWGG